MSPPDVIRGEESNGRGPELAAVRAALSALSLAYAHAVFDGVAPEVLDLYASGLQRFSVAIVREVVADWCVTEPKFPTLAELVAQAKAAQRRALSADAQGRERLSVEDAVARAEAEDRARRANLRRSLEAPTTEAALRRAADGTRPLEFRGDEGDVPPPDWREHVRKALKRSIEPEPPEPAT